MRIFLVFAYIVSILADTTYEIEHSLDEKSFSKRGEIYSFYSPLTKDTEFKVEETHRISAEEADSFQALLNSDGYYRIRIRSITKDSSSPYVMSSIKACFLRVSRFKEELVLFLTPEGVLQSISYGTDSNVQKCSSDLTPIPSSGVKFKTNISKGKVVPSPVLPLHMDSAAPPPGVKVDPDSKEAKQAAEANKPWYQKYWYYILPIAIYLLVGGGEEKKGGVARPPARGE